MLEELHKFQGKTINRVEVESQQDIAGIGLYEKHQLERWLFYRNVKLHFTDGSELMIRSDSTSDDHISWPNSPKLTFDWQFADGSYLDDPAIALEQEVHRLYERQSTLLKNCENEGKKIDIDPEPTAHAGALWALDQIINFLASTGIRVWDAQKQIQQANEEAMALQYRLSTSEKRVTQLEKDIKDKDIKIEALEKTVNGRGEWILEKERELAEKDVEIMRLKAMLFDKMQGR